ncbi:hypothetical protein ES702_00390 [subsurface metagenome]
MAHYTRESEVSENREVPAICPLINKCAQYHADQEEYKSLCKKWTEHAESQESDEFEVERSRVLTGKGFRGKKETIRIEHAQPVTGTQVFHLEYNPTEGMSPQQQKELENKKKERFEQMCPHFKGDVLGLPTSDPAYHDCRTFSEWFYKKRG